jgi:hypothetical protein
MLSLLAVGIVPSGCGREGRPLLSVVFAVPLVSLGVANRKSSATSLRRVNAPDLNAPFLNALADLL